MYQISHAFFPIQKAPGPMYRILNSKWQLINQRCLTRTEANEDNPESQEVLEEQLTRQLSRDYIDWLCSVCWNKRNDPAEDKMQDENDIAQPQTRELGELGILCVETETICESLVLCVLDGLLWNDTQMCNRCIGLCYPLLKQLLKDNKLSSAAANHFYTRILSSLQLHGAHEASQSLLLGLGLQAYELLRPQFAEICFVMFEIPNCTDVALKKNVGEMFRREIHYKSLPNLFRHTKPKQLTLDETEHKDIGLCSLFTPETNGTS